MNKTLVSLGKSKGEEDPRSTEKDQPDSLLYHSTWGPGLIPVDARLNSADPGSGVFFRGPLLGVTS